MEGWEKEKLTIPAGEIQEGFLEEVAFGIALKNEQELSRYKRGYWGRKGQRGRGRGRENLMAQGWESLENSDKLKVGEAAGM